MLLTAVHIAQITITPHSLRVGDDYPYCLLKCVISILSIRLLPAYKLVLLSTMSSTIRREKAADLSCHIIAERYEVRAFKWAPER